MRAHLLLELQLGDDRAGVKRYLLDVHPGSSVPSVRPLAAGFPRRKVEGGCPWAGGCLDVSAVLWQCRQHVGLTCAPC